jgi:hypothetical protein
VCTTQGSLPYREVLRGWGYIDSVIAKEHREGRVEGVEGKGVGGARFWEGSFKTGSLKIRFEEIARDVG